MLFVSNWDHIPYHYDLIKNINWYNWRTILVSIIYWVLQVGLYRPRPITRRTLYKTILTVKCVVFFKKLFRVFSLSACPNSVDLALVLDMSGSDMENHDFELNISRRIVERLDFGPWATNGGSRVGLITYAKTATVWFSLATHFDALANLIEAFNIIPPVNEGTNAYDALTLMQSTLFNNSPGDRIGSSNVAVVITDGRSNLQQDRTLPAAVAARNAGTSIYVIGVGDVNEVETVGIAGAVSNYMRVSNDREASQAVDFITQRLCDPWFH